MLTILQAILLGLIQGITEWLPVSSSGHLAVTQHYFGLEVPVLFDVILHLGTLVVIFLVFYRDIGLVFKALAKADFRSEDGRLAAFIVIGILPTALIGYVFHDLFVSFFTNMAAVGAALVFTGFVLCFTRKATGNKPLNTRHSLLIGTAQGIAIIPGVSRSGLTISAGLLAGVDRARTVRFSFLLLIPAIMGAALYEMGDMSLLAADWLAVLAGFLTSVAAGYFSLKLLVRVVMRGRLHLFSAYCWLAGAILILFQFV